VAERLVALALAASRAPWFRELPRQSTAGALPVDVVPCISRAELEARLQSGRHHSALLVEANPSFVDRDLVELAAARGCAVILIGDEVGGAPILAGLDVDARLGAAFSRDELLAALERCVHTIAPAGTEHVDAPSDGASTPGSLVGVLGTGGAGTSTLAAALAQGLAFNNHHNDYRHDTGPAVLLADLALNGEQAMLHGTADLVPGLPELVEAHRIARPSRAEVRSMTFEISARHYHLLLGLRRHRDWAALRPRAFGLSLASLLASFDIVVADIDGDVEGEATTGSQDVEERNTLARAVVSRSDAVVVVGVASMKGVHSLCRLVSELCDLGVPLGAIQPVMNHQARSLRARAELTRAVAALTAALVGRVDDLRPVRFVPTKRAVEVAHRDATVLPASIASALASAVTLVLTDTQPRISEPDLVHPGSLGLAGTRS
jgi:hypothetical protein